MRILVVEDEPRVADAVARGLTAQGYAVDVAADGEEGLWRVREHAYDAVLLDLMLPKVSGPDVLRAMRRDGIWTPVLVLTARTDDRDVAGTLDLGADDHLAKPFSLVVLSARVRALVRRGTRERPALLSAGDLALDPATHRCRRGDDDVVLTRREFAVLEYLMRHADRAVSKRELLDHVWDERDDGDPNVVEVYVGYLRRKLDVPYGRRAIETVRGAGYLLRSDGG